MLGQQYMLTPSVPRFRYTTQRVSPATKKLAGSVVRIRFPLRSLLNLALWSAWVEKRWRYLPRQLPCHAWTCLPGSHPPHSHACGLYTLVRSHYLKWCLMDSRVPCWPRRKSLNAHQASKAPKQNIMPRAQSSQGIGYAHCIG